MFSSWFLPIGLSRCSGSLETPPNLLFSPPARQTSDHVFQAINVEEVFAPVPWPRSLDRQLRPPPEHGPSPDQQERTLGRVLGRRQRRDGEGQPSGHRRPTQAEGIEWTFISFKMLL